MFACIQSNRCFSFFIFSTFLPIILFCAHTKDKPEEEHFPTLKEIREKLEFNVHLQDRTVIQGDSVKLICAVVGIKSELRWYHDTAEVSYTGRIVNEGQPKEGFACLHIKRALPEDSGVYTCMAKNDKERIETKCRLTVIPQEDFIKPDPDVKEDLIEPIFITGIKGK